MQSHDLKALDVLKMPAKVQSQRVFDFVVNLPIVLASQLNKYYVSNDW